MDEMCIDNFLEQCRPSRVERHSDSSDFETTYNAPVKDNNINSPVVAPKEGYHSIFKNKASKKRNKDEVTRRLCNNFQLYSVNTQYYDKDNIPEKEMKIYPRRQVLCNKNLDCTPNFNETGSMGVSSNTHKRDQTEHFKEKCCSRLSVRSKLVPSLSTILKRSNNCKTRSIPDNYYYCDTANNAYSGHLRTKKLSKPRGDYSVQPVYAVAKETAGFPFQRTNVDGIERHNSSDDINEYSLSSGSEQDDIKPYKHKKLIKYIMHKLEKRILREYASVGTIKHQKQQYPSKLQIHPPYQVFATSSCQTKNASSDSESHSAMPSNSSEFWDFLLQKIKFQIHKAEVHPCDKESCGYFKANSNTSNNKPKPQPKDSFDRCQPSGQSSNQAANLPKKKSDNSEVICKCFKQNKSYNRDKSYNPDKTQSQDVTKPCQEDHNALNKTLADKYNGEVLCIHNPPCVLINGCLNLPQPKTSNAQASLFYPVAQSKRSSFAQMCRKMKRKQKSQDQAIQYQPPVDLQEYLPEFKTEKIVQSVCNHNPPCEVVRGCHKPRFNPTLQTSCIHVPMCPKLPECLLEQRNIDERTCNHTPKCAELPLCSRKYITLTAKENATTQVKPKTKIGCRHQPPCLMIPKCLAQVICGDWYPGNAIPGCMHQPSCDMIPACIRKPVKESVSVQSQYPSASCRIV